MTCSVSFVKPEKETSHQPLAEEVVKVQQKLNNATFIHTYVRSSKKLRLMHLLNRYIFILDPYFNPCDFILIEVIQYSRHSGLAEKFHEHVSKEAVVVHMNLM